MRIKIFFNRIHPEELQDYFPIRVLLDNFDIIRVNKKEDAGVIVGLAERFHARDYLDQSKKNIIISGENIFFRRNLFNILESLLFKVIKERKYRMMDLLNLVFPKFISSFPLTYFLSDYVRILRRIEKGELKNTYFILSNKSESKNTIVFPLFLQYYYSKINKLSGRANDNGKRKKFCAFIVSSNSSRERISFFKKLNKYKKVDSYGKVMNNMGKEFLGKTWINNSDIFKNYKFVICFENSFDEEYITEKLPNVMFSGAIPVYRGALNIGKYFNTKSFINYEDYGSYEKMINKIIELDKKATEYDKISKEPWFRENKIPQSIKSKERELIEFYKEILNEK